MNPFTFTPSKILNASGANYVLGLYKTEIAHANAIRSGIENNLSAIVDVLVKAHPNLEADIHLLIEHARYAGHADGQVQDLTALESQFRSALPWLVKKELSA